jgi:hypothetical protein
VANGTGTCIVADATGNLYLSFVELDLPGDVLFSKSADGGLNWSVPVVLGRSITQTNTHCDVDESGKHVYVAWSGTPDRYDDIWVAHSGDGGAAWGAAVLVNDDGQQRLPNDRPDLAVDIAGTVHIAWFDARDGSGAAWYSNSTDHGATWTRNVRVSDDAKGKDCGGAFNHYSELVITPYGDVAYAWCDGREGTQLGDADIWFAAAPIAAGRLPKKQLAKIEVEPASATITVDQTMQFTARGLDLNGSPMPIRPVWTASGGAVDQAGLFTPSAAGAFTVTASWGAVSGSANVAVTPGALASLELSPASASITERETAKFSAAGKDSKGNAVPVAPQWSASGGSIDSSGLFTPDSPGTFTVTASDSGVSASATVLVTDIDDTPPTILHEPAAAAVAGRDLPLEAAVSDDSGVSTVTLHYQSSPSGSFTAVAMSESKAGRYSAVVNGSELVTPLLEYYIEARDPSGNSAVSPSGAPARLHVVKVTSPPEPPAGPKPPASIPFLPLLILAAVVAVSLVALAGWRRRRTWDCARCGRKHSGAGPCLPPQWWA